MYFRPPTAMSQAENSHTPERRSSANMERHIQTIMISVITGALMFAANYFYNDNRSKAVQQSQLEVLTGQVIEMRADLRSLQNSYVKREEYKELETRVRHLEARSR
jgi:Tfp pilus assembly protein PilN